MPRKKKNQLDSGNFRTQVYLGKDENGKRLYKSFTATTKAEALRQAEIFKNNLKGKNDPSLMSLGEAIENYISMREATLAKTTLRDYRAFKKYFDRDFPAYMNIDLYRFDSDSLQCMIDDMLESGLASKTVRNRASLVITVLRHFDIELKHYNLPRKDEPDLYVPTDAEMEKLFEASRDTCMEVPILLASFAAARCGEVLGLREDAISGNVIHIYRTMWYGGAGVGEQLKNVPKTKASNRFIPVSDKVMDAINRNGLPKDMTHKTINYYFKRLLEKCELHDFRFHDLRHWCISTLHAQGLPDQYIMKISGHSSVSTLQRVYRHTLADKESEFTQRALAHFDSLL